MRRYFNTEGLYYSDEYYMVKLDKRLNKIKKLSYVFEMSSLNMFIVEKDTKARCFDMDSRIEINLKKMKSSI